MKYQEMYLSNNINSKITYKSTSLQERYLQKCKSTSYLQNTLSQSQNPAITMTDLQWLSSKEILL